MNEEDECNEDDLNEREEEKKNEVRKLSKLDSDCFKLQSEQLRDNQKENSDLDPKEQER